MASLLDSRNTFVDLKVQKLRILTEETIVEECGMIADQYKGNSEKLKLITNGQDWSSAFIGVGKCMNTGCFLLHPLDYVASNVHIRLQRSDNGN